MYCARDATFSVMRRILPPQLCVLVSLSLTPCSGIGGQAPGDEGDNCPVDHDDPPSYPDTVKNLMDSYSYYEHLLPPDGTGPLWNSRSIVTNEINTVRIHLKEMHVVSLC